jgi:hypothetical protein
LSRKTHEFHPREKRREEEEERRQEKEEEDERRQEKEEEEEEEDMSFRSQIIRRRDMFPMKISPLTKHGSSRRRRSDHGWLAAGNFLFSLFSSSFLFSSFYNFSHVPFVSAHPHGQGIGERGGHEGGERYHTYVFSRDKKMDFEGGREVGVLFFRLDV